MSKALIRKILLTAQILLGVSGAIAGVWQYVLPFNPEELISFIDFILVILLPTTLTISAGRRLRDEFKRFNY